jgi:hypothetical protein
LKETQALETELSRLRDEKATLQVQSRLLEKFVTLARATKKERVLAAILKKTLKFLPNLPVRKKAVCFYSIPVVLSRTAS